MTERYSDGPEAFELSQTGDDIQVTAHPKPVLLDALGEITLGHLAYETTESIDVRVVLEHQDDCYACFGAIQLPIDTSKKSPYAAYYEAMDALAEDGQIFITNRGNILTGFGWNSAGIINVIYLHKDDSEAPPTVFVVAKIANDPEGMDGDPHFLPYSDYPANDIAKGIGHTVAEVANALHNRLGSHQQATLDIALPDSKPSSTAVELYNQDLPEHQNFPNFDQFGGLDREISQLRDAVRDIGSPELLEKYRLKRRSGILLQGPPGVAKTELVRALAREMRAYYEEVTVGDILDPYVGNSEQKLAELFNNAQASDRLTVLFFDEFDGLFSKNAGGNSGGARSLIAQFKTLLSNASQYQNVLVVAAANSLDNFDPALLRPGRFDTVIKIGNPNEAAREQIFNKYLYAGAQHYDVVTTEHIPSSPIQIKELAQQAEGFNGADIKQVLTDLLWVKMRGERDTGEEPPRITHGQIIQAIKAYSRNRPSDL